MEDKELVQGDLGKAGKYDVAFKEGKLVAEMDMSMGQSSAGMIIKIDGSQVFEALKALVHNKIADDVLSVMESAILGK